jgi:hypothetical protein
MKLHITIGLAALTTLSPGFADTCAPIMKSAAAYAKAERYVVNMTMVSQGQTHNTEVMMSPEGMYIKAGEQWIRSPVSINRQEILDANKSVFSDCARVGQENVDGAPTSVYRFTGKAEGQPPMTGKMWIGTADDLPRRMQARTKDGDITQNIRYDVEAPKAAVGIPGLNQLKNLFK